LSILVLLKRNFMSCCCSFSI